MLQQKTIEINGRSYTMTQLPADTAFDVTCIVAEWRGLMIEAVGLEAAAFSEALQDVPIEKLTLGGKFLQIQAKMLRDPEYRAKVWNTVLGACTCEGVAVLRGDWALTYAGERMADLYTLHMAAVDHSCAGFLQVLGTGAAPAPQASAGQ